MVLLQESGLIYQDPVITDAMNPNSQNNYVFIQTKVYNFVNFGV